ncbi:MAG: hypothetical protein LBK57_07460 [Clostridiales Family XIII bacterium]|jgi:hypothetical protein|nr:hypothetical protein [Clostridiales Family XIII bacterium]
MSSVNYSSRKSLVLDFENGTYNDTAPLYLELGKYINGLAIDVVAIEYESGTVEIYVHSVADALTAKGILQEHDDEFAEYFRTLARRHGWRLKQLPKHLSVKIRSFDIQCVEFLARESTEEIRQAIRLGWETVKYVFFHSASSEYSLPGFYVIFTSPETLGAIDKNEEDRILNVCDHILQKNDKSGCYQKDCIALECCDEITDSKILYFLSRQD